MALTIKENTTIEIELENNVEGLQGFAQLWKDMYPMYVLTSMFQSGNKLIAHLVKENT